MKKIYAFLIALMLCFTAHAEVNFAYEAGAEIVSSYIWRGQYNGGLSFQPEILVGLDALDETVQFRAGAWGTIGASDWKFRSSTYPVNEWDFLANVTAYGATIGYTHYYYCDKELGTGEIQVGYNFDHFFGVGAYINWYTTVVGNDMIMDKNNSMKRAWSTYIELGYDYTFENIGLTLGGQLGMSPWTSYMYYNKNFAVINITLKINKEWEFDNVALDLFALWSLNPDSINRDNVFIDWSDNDKQKMNSAIGLGIWF